MYAEKVRGRSLRVRAYLRNWLRTEQLKLKVYKISKHYQQVEYLGWLPDYLLFHAASEA